MLMCIVDFTIPGSCCNLFYEHLPHKFLTKSYKKLEEKDPYYFVNGNVYNGKSYVFKKFGKEQFEKNKKMLYLDNYKKLRCYSEEKQCNIDDLL